MKQIVGRRVTYKELTGKTWRMDETTSSPETAGTRAIRLLSGESMKADPFDSTPEFKEFKDVMRGILWCPKKAFGCTGASREGSM